MLASDILSRVRTQLIDPSAARWSDAELLRWLSDAQRTVVSLAPSATATRAIVAMAAGTRQVLPADAHILLTLERNNNAGGTAPGRAVRIGSREVMDAYDPNWHTALTDPVVRTYTFDPVVPTEFYVSPPNDGTGYVEVIYAKIPGELATTADVLSVRETYQQALVDYVMYRAHQKDDDYAAGGAVASGYLQLFMAQVLADGQSQDAASANKSLGPDIQTRGGVA